LQGSPRTIRDLSDDNLHVADVFEIWMEILGIEKKKWSVQVLGRHPPNSLSFLLPPLSIPLPLFPSSFPLPSPHPALHPVLRNISLSLLLFIFNVLFIYFIFVLIFTLFIADL
jgi:hypothetical protein